MFVRISFDDNQDINESDLTLLNTTLGERVDYDPLVKQLEDGKLDTFRDYWHTFNPTEINTDNNKKRLVEKSEFVRLKSTKEYIADLDLFVQLHPEIKIKIRGLMRTIETNNFNVIQKMKEIQEKFEKALKTFDKQIEFNEKCDVHIGNLGLLHINQVGYFEDGCTQKLQEYLNQGWRILAVCPQPDQRRPDYICGRYNPAEVDLACFHLS